MVLRSQTARIQKLKEQLTVHVTNGLAHIETAKALQPFQVDKSIPLTATVHNILADLSKKRKVAGDLRYVTDSLQHLGAEWGTILRALDDATANGDYLEFIAQYDLNVIRGQINEQLLHVESIIQVDEQIRKEKEEDRVEERTSRPSSTSQSRQQTPNPTNEQGVQNNTQPKPDLINAENQPTNQPITAVQPTDLSGVAFTLANMSSIFHTHSHPPLTVTAPSFGSYADSSHLIEERRRPPVVTRLPAPPSYSPPSVRTDLGLRLPRLESLKFTGNIEEYSSWRAWFQEAIDQLPISSVQKAQHLSSLVSGDAARVIANIPLAEYSNMLSALKDAFDRPEKVLELTIKRFDSIPPIKYNHEVSELLIQLKGIDRALKAHGATLNSPLLLHRIEALLTPQLQMEVRRYRQAHSGKWDLPAFFGVLQNLEHLFVPRRSAAPAAEVRPLRTFAVTQSERKRWPCLFCAEHTHRTTDCPAFSTLNKRETRLQELRRCIRCLSSAHQSGDCLRTCAQCNGQHHRLICPKLRSNQTLLSVETNPIEDDETAHLDAEIEENEQSQEHSASEDHDQHHTFISRADGRILPSCKAKIRHPHNPAHEAEVLILLDTCADATYVTKDVAEALQLKVVGRKTVQNETFGGHKRTSELSVVEFDLPLQNGKIQTVEAYVVPNIVHTLNVLERTTNNDRINHTRRRPNVLLGWSVCPAVFGLEVNEENGYHTIPTNIGTVITQFTSKAKESDSTTTLVVQSPDDLINEYWSIEKIGLESDNKTDDINEHLWQEFQKNTKQLPSGHYQVHWLWNERKDELQTNFELAFRRTTSTLRRLDQNQEQLGHFRTIIEQQLTDGIIEKVCGKKEESSVVHYLPYQLVLKDSKTTPVRIVYDGSARCGRSPSINDCVHVGPLNLVDVVGILLRARTDSILVSSDVSKAFHRLQLAEEDRDSVRFLIPFDWNQPFGRNNVQVVRFRSVPFGIACSPSLLDMCIRLHLSKSPVLLARRSSIYVDNIICSYQSEQEALQDSIALRDHLKTAGLPLQEFYSNSPLVLEQMNEGKNHSEDTKLLGVHWSPRTDRIRITVPLAHDQTVTKRTIASRNHKPFDPLGLLAPLFVSSKIFIHKLWERGADWDEAVNDFEFIEWQQIEENLAGDFEIPRMATVPNETTRELHVFCDASQLAFGLAAYIVTSNGREAKSSLVFAKSRIAPKTLRSTDLHLTIPKLELQSLTIATRAAHFLTEQMERIKHTVVWSDSSIALYQVSDPSTSKSIFVRNRAHEVARSRSQFEFRHVETEDNPADLVSRGCNAKTLKANKKWWNGPAWLPFHKNWPSTLVLPIVEAPETRTEAPNTHTSLLSIQTNQLATIGSDWADSVAKTIAKLADHNDPNTPATREWAEAILIRFDQENHPPGAKKIDRLRLKADERGVFRAQTRLDYSELPTASHRPIWLPTSGQITAQIASDTHTRLLHAGFSTVLTDLRQRFHISPKVVKGVQSNCAQCRLFDANPFSTPEWAPLPSDRSTSGRPFQFTGIDHAGPLKCKEGEFYILIFVCGRTRAIHLEMCRSTSTDEFLLAFDKFEARRGTPNVILSDNSQTFNTASAILTPRLRTRASFEWRQITPRAPWRGGMYEALIKPVKSALKRTIGRSLWPCNRLEALIVKIETVVNSRPLLRESTGVVLRPLDFLRPDGQPNTPIDFDELEQLIDETYESEAPRRLHQQLIRQNRAQLTKIRYFWNTWSSLYLTSLLDNDHSPSNSRTTRRPPQIGECVLISDDFSNRLHWPVGRIRSLADSPDGIVRTAEVLTEDGKVLTRAINQLYPLEVRADSESASSSPPAAPNGESEETSDLKQNSSLEQPTETNGLRKQPARKAKEQQRSLMKSILPLLSIVGLMIAFLPVGSAAKLCFPGAPTTYWTAPNLPSCPTQLITKHTQPTAQKLELYERNFAESSTLAHLCTFHHREVFGGTQLSGMTDIREEQRDPLPISASDCWQMINTKRCKFGRLVQADSSWHTRSQFQLAIPNRVMSLFGYSSAIRKDCSFVETRVITHNSAKTIRTNAASTPHCKYSSGICQIAPNSIIVWKPKADAECSYVQTGIFEGQLMENHWVSNEAQLLLDITNETISDCGKDLTLTSQGWAILPVRTSRKKRDEHENSSLSTKAEESGHARFLQQQMLDVILNQMRTTCEFIAQQNLLVTDILLAHPQRTMERLFNQSAIQVRSIGKYIEIHWCKHIETNRLQLQRTTSCTERIPVRIDGEYGDWFWDVETDELKRESGRRLDCTETRITQFGLQLYSYSFEAAEFTPIAVHELGFSTTPSLQFTIKAQPIVIHSISRMRALLFADQIADFQRLATAHNEWKLAIDSSDLHAVHQPPFDWKEWFLSHIAPWVLLVWRIWITICGTLGCIQAFRIIRKATEPKDPNNNTPNATSLPKIKAPTASTPRRTVIREEDNSWYA